MYQKWFKLGVFTLVFILALALMMPAGQAVVSQKVQVSTNGRYLVTEDGQPFFYLGDTAWELFHRLNRSEVDTFLTNRVAKGINVIQCVLLAELDGLNTPNVYGYKPLINNDPYQPDVRVGDDYWDHCDYIINKADDLGLYVGLLPTWGDKVDLAWGVGPLIFNTTDKAYDYGNFVGDRYKNKKNIIWILGGDRDPAGEEAIWRAMAEGIADGVNGVYSFNSTADYSTTCMTIHTASWESSGYFFHTDAWLDFNMYQSGHSAYNLADIWTECTENYVRTPAKPVVNGEPNYEDHPVNWNPSNGWFNDYDVRKAAYWSLFAGCMGYTYGAHGIWQMYAPGRTPISSARTYWYNSLDFTGAFDLIHVKNLMLSRPYFTRIPDQGLLNTEGTGGDHVQATRSSDGAYAMVYFPRETTSRTVRASYLSGTEINAWWYNTRDGKCYNQSGAETTQPFETFAKADRTFDPPGSNSVLDWVLVLDDASKGYGAPGILGPPATPTLSPTATPTLTPTPTITPTLTPGAIPPPIVELKLNENTGTSTVNTGTTGGSATLTATRPIWSTNVPPNGGVSSVDFGTTTGNYGVDLTSAVNSLKGLKSFTITGWLNCRSNTVGAGGNRVVTWINNGGDGVDLVYQSDGSLQVGIDQWPDGVPARSSASKITTDANAGAANWRFFAVTYDPSLASGDVKFYFGSPTVDATLDGGKDYDRGDTGTNIGPALTVGHFNTASRSAATDRMFRGLIDQVRVYGSTVDSSCALTLEQVVYIQKESFSNATPTPSATPSPTATPTVTSTSSVSVTPTTTIVPTASVTATATLSPTATATVTLTPTLSPTASVGPTTVIAKKIGVSMTIDGNLSETVWSLEKSVAKTIVGTPNNTVTYGVLWDNSYLYIGIRVLDGSLRNDSTNAWDDDSVEIYIDGNHNMGTSYDSYDRQIVKGWNDTGIWANGNQTTGILHGCAAVTGGFTVEVAIPWSNLGITATSGMIVGIDIGNNDDDDGSARESQLLWVGTNNNWTDTSTFGDCYLSGDYAGYTPPPSAPPTATPSPTPTLSPTPTITVSATATVTIVPTATVSPTSTTSPTPTATATSSAAFVKGVNLNGNAVTIEGNNWFSYADAKNNGLSTTTVNTTTNSVTPNPAVDSATTHMLNTAIWYWANFTVNQTLTNGNYKVYLWVMENHQSNYRSFNVKMEGTQVATGIGNLALGTWVKYGPYNVTVSDGTLNVEFVKVTNDPHIMGMEIHTN